jgi:predicted NBD/HSP70 family sugar kinase
VTKILVVDIGGTHVKATTNNEDAVVKIVSGPKLSPDKMVKRLFPLISGLEYDVVSVGLPTFVYRGRAVCEPANLGDGWLGFNFEEAFKSPVKIINDAAMQALGSYEGGRMLFLGLGTGLGAALVDNAVLEPLEVAHLHYRKGRSFEDYLGLRGLQRLGKQKWRAHVNHVIAQLAERLAAEYTVIGGGNARLLKELPPQAKLGENANAFLGGFRLWTEIDESRRK